MSPELELVARCCRWPDDDVRRERVEEAIRPVSNWNLVVQLTRAHRVEGLVANALKAQRHVPPETQAALREMADQVRRKAIESVAETLRVCRAFEAANVDFRILKGLAVAVRAYGTVGIKNSVDVDLLVRPSAAPRAAEILVELGYQARRPPRPLTREEFASWSAVAKESLFISPRGQVDLHWDLLDQPAVLHGLDPWHSPVTVQLLPGHEVPTIPQAEHLAYLAGHGAMTGWSRLKWLADFAAFANARPAAEAQGLCAAAGAMAGRAMDQGLILVERLLGPGYPAPQQRGAETIAIADLAQQLIESRTPGVVLEKQRDALLLLSRSQWRLRGGLRYKTRELERRFREQEIRFRYRFRAPRRLSWLLWSLRLPGFLVGIAARWKRGDIMDPHA